MSSDSALQRMPSATAAPMATSIQRLALPCPAIGAWSSKRSGPGTLWYFTVTLDPYPFLGLLGFLIRQLKVQFAATLLSAAKRKFYHARDGEPGGLGRFTLREEVCSLAGRGRGRGLGFRVRI